MSREWKVSEGLNSLLNARINAAHSVAKYRTVNSVMDAEEAHDELLKAESSR
jgi:hypothetical protein